jgi:CspA family cold shock protein
MSVSRASITGLIRTLEHPGIFGKYYIQTLRKLKKMATGTVKWFNTNKGYGFIAPDDGGKDVFVHITELEKSGIRQLDDGQKVSYEVAENRGKEAAASIQLAD